MNTIRERKRKLVTESKFKFAVAPRKIKYINKIQNLQGYWKYLLEENIKDKGTSSIFWKGLRKVRSTNTGTKEMWKHTA